jgi:hypothetical protein
VTRGDGMSEKTIFLLIFIVSTALLLYVEATDESNDQYIPECQESSDPYITTEDCVQPVQEEIRPNIMNY